MADISHIAIEGAGEYDIKDGKARDDDSRQDDNLRQLWNKLAELQTVVDTANAEITAIKQELQAESGLIGTNIEDIAALKSGKVNKAGDTMTGNLTINRTGSSSNPVISLISDTNDVLRKMNIISGDGYSGIDRVDTSSNTVLNRLQLNDGSTNLLKALNVTSGGTGATTGQGACDNLMLGIATLHPRGVAFRPGTTSNSGGWLDFHWNNAASYTSNIYESSSGTLSINGTPFKRGAALPVANGGTGQTSITGNPGLIQSMFANKLPNAECVAVFTNGWANGGYMNMTQLRTALGIPYMKTWTITTTATANAGQQFTQAQLGVTSNQSRAFDKNKDFLFLTNGDTSAQNVGVRRCQYQTNGTFWVEFSSAPTAGSIRFTCLLVQGV